MCCLRDIFLCFVCHLSNSKYNTSISGVKYSWTSLYNYHGQQNPARGENFPKSPFCPENKCFSSEDTRVEMVLFRERDTTIKLASHLHLRYSSKAERSESSCETRTRYQSLAQFLENVGSRSCLSFTVPCKKNLTLHPARHSIFYDTRGIIYVNVNRCELGLSKYLGAAIKGGRPNGFLGLS